MLYQSVHIPLFFFFRLLLLLLFFSSSPSVDSTADLFLGNDIEDEWILDFLDVSQEEEEDILLGGFSVDVLVTTVDTGSERLTAILTDPGSL